MYIGMQRWSQSLWKYSDSIAHSSMEFGSSSGSHDERLLRPLLRRKQETPVRSHSSVWENEARPICDNLKYHPKLSQHSGLGPRSPWRRSVLLWKAWKHSCVMCSQKTSWGVDVHMDPHANSLMMKFTGLRRFGGGSWGEGGVGVSALLSLSDEYEAPQTPSTPAPCMWAVVSHREKVAGSRLHLNPAELTLPMLLALKTLYNKEGRTTTTTTKIRADGSISFFVSLAWDMEERCWTERSINWRAASVETSLNPLSPGFPSQLQWKEMRFSAHNVKLVWL